MKNPYIALGADHVRLNFIRNFHLEIARDPAIDLETREAAIICAEFVDEASLYALAPEQVGEIEVIVNESDIEHVEILLLERANAGEGLEYFGATVTYRWSDTLSSGCEDEREIRWSIDTSGGCVDSVPCSLIGAYQEALDRADLQAVIAHELEIEEVIDDERRNGWE